MDEEQAANNVNGTNEKKLERKSKKDKKNKESTREQEAPNSEKEDIFDMENDHKKRPDKKKNKGKKDAVTDKEKGSREGELTDVNGENGSESTLAGAERKRKRKRKKREKNKNEKLENTNTEEVEEKESNIMLEGESVSRKKSGKEANKERKKQKLKTDHEDGKIQVGENGGEVTGTDIENCKVDATKMVEKKKKKKDKNGDNGSESALDSAERRRKRREKNKNEKLENTNTEKVEENDSNIILEGESVSRKKSGKEANKERKKTDQEDGKIQVGEKGGEVSGTHIQNSKADATEMVEKKKKKKDKKKGTGDDAIRPQDTYSEVKHDEGDVQSTKDDGQTTKEPERKKEKIKKRENCKDDSSAAQQDFVGNGSNDLDNISEIENANKKKKRKVEKVSDDRQDNEVEHANNGKKRKTMLVEDGPSVATPNASNKKVSFSGEDEVFAVPYCSSEEGNVEEDNLVIGKRFTKEENEIVKQAVLNYIEEHELGDEGLDMILNCRKHPKLKNCWKEIGLAVPYRPYRAVYNRARIIFMRSESRKWTQEEKDAVLAYQKEHGNKWKPLADELGKHTWHVKDAYRRIKLLNRNKGHWSQTEYQKLFDLVNTDLQLKISEEKKSKHGMLRDNISWTAISEVLLTRSQAGCCLKWYTQLTSPMVADGVWSDSDDYRLLSALYSLDATCMEDVDWDGLIENRSGDLCRKRWNQMVLHIGHYGRKSFAERVDVLAQRYCPNILEAREIWDNKPRVP